jgi:hypothetical protein
MHSGAQGCGLFQTANNTAVMKDIQACQRGVISGMRTSFAVAALLIVAALAIAAGTWRHTLRNRDLPQEAELRVVK